MSNSKIKTYLFLLGLKSKRNLERDGRKVGIQGKNIAVAIQTVITIKTTIAIKNCFIMNAKSQSGKRSIFTRC